MQVIWCQLFAFLLIVQNLLHQVVVSETPTTTDASNATKPDGEETRNVARNPYASVISIINLQTDRNGDTSTITCGGSILTSEWVITAAHCLLANLSQNHSCVVGAGSFYHVQKPEEQNTNDRIQVRYCKEYFRHPKYTEEKGTKGYKFDVGLVYLMRPFTLRRGYIEVGKYAPDSEWTTNNCYNEIGVAPGWDKEYDVPSPSTNVEKNQETLIVRNLTIISYTECQGWLQAHLDDSVLCAISTPKFDPCTREPGLPIYCNRSVVGSASSIGSCGVHSNVTLYTKIDKFWSWISDITSYEISAPSSPGAPSNENNQFGIKIAEIDANSSLYLDEEDDSEDDDADYSEERAVYDSASKNDLYLTFGFLSLLPFVVN